MMTILLGDGICNEINVLTSNFILLGYQLLSPTSTNVNIGLKPNIYKCNIGLKPNIYKC